MKGQAGRSAIAILGSLLLLSGVTAAKPGKGGDKKGGPPAQAQKAGKDKGPQGNSGAAKNEVKDKDKGPKPGKGPKVKVKGGGPGPEIVRYVDRDRQRVIDYFDGQKGHPHGLPPGLAKRLRNGKPLPPGWQKKLSPGWVIDEGWWPSFSPLPYGWFPDLPVVPDTGLYLYDDRVVRVYEPRREVVDVIIVPTIHIDL